MNEINGSIKINGIIKNCWNSQNYQKLTKFTEWSKIDEIHGIIKNWRNSWNYQTLTKFFSLTKSPGRGVRTRPPPGPPMITIAILWLWASMPGLPAGEASTRRLRVILRVLGLWGQAPGEWPSFSGCLALLLVSQACLFLFTTHKLTELSNLTDFRN